MRDEDGKLKEETLFSPIYPTTKAIMQRVYCTLELRRWIPFGLKYDETFFEVILGELLMAGAVQAIYDKETDEMNGWMFVHKEI